MILACSKHFLYVHPPLEPQFDLARGPSLTIVFSSRVCAVDAFKPARLSRAMTQEVHPEGVHGASGRGSQVSYAKHEGDAVLIPRVLPFRKDASRKEAPARHASLLYEHRSVDVESHRNVLHHPPPLSACRHGKYVAVCMRVGARRALKVAS